MKKKLAIMLCLILLITMQALPVSAAAPVPSVVIDGQAVSFDVAPVIDNGRIMLPLRVIFEQMGAVVTWDEATQTASAVKGDVTVVVKIGSTSPTINGVTKTIDVPAKIVDGRTLAPLRFVCEAFGGVVSWDANTYVANVVTAGSNSAQPGTTTETETQVQPESSEQMSLTLQQAVDLAVQNNPQVKLAQIDRDKKSRQYSQSKSVSKQMEDIATYQGQLAYYLAPKIAERQEQQAEKVYNITVNGVKIQAESAYYELIKARENQQIAVNALDRAEAQLKIANDKFAVGSSAKLEVLQAETARAAAQAALTAAQNNTKQKMLELNKIIGVDLTTLITTSGIFEFQPEEFKLASLMENACQESLSVIKAQDTADIAKWTYDYIVSYYGSGNWDAKVAKEDVNAAVVLLKQTQDNTIITINQTYSGYLAVIEQYQYLLKAVELSREAYRLQQISYEVGMATYEDVQKASDDLQKAEAGLSDCIYNYNLIKSSLKYNIYS